MLRRGHGAIGLARVFLTFAALLPYWRLLTFSVIFVTDDYFASDIFNGELPGRAIVGQLLRQGRAPVWTNQLCSGLPLAGSPADPIGLAAFALLPPAPALDLFVIVLLLVAAHGTYSLARRFGTDRTSAVLAGVAFAGSGYVACQLKHLAIVSTVVWLPVGLLLLDRALAADDERTIARRLLSVGAFGLVFAQQVLAGFPQSAYICALVYGSFVLYRAIAERRRLGSWRLSISIVAAIGLATALGAAVGAVVLLPLSALGVVSDRSEALGWIWSTYLAYWPPNILTFLFPYAHGDISDNSYAGPPFFWEDYGYLGILTFILAIYATARERKRPGAAFVIGMTLVAYLFVLGSATPVFRAAYVFIPGMKLFRFPTRFLIVVELGIALLGAIGLTRLRADLARRWGAESPLPRLIAIGICAATALDLFIHQPRQNPMVSGRQWLAPPPSVDVIRADNPAPRTFTPRHRDIHRRVFQQAHGWADVSPYFQFRDALQPNLGGGFWDVPSADCYAGIVARWSIDLWGDHNREMSVMALLASPDFEKQTLRLRPPFARIMRMYGVTHVLSPFAGQGEALTPLGRAGTAYVYRVEGTARVRFVSAARAVATEQEAVGRILDPAFDPDREILLHDAPESAVTSRAFDASSTASAPTSGRATVSREEPGEVVIDAEAPDDGFLLLADTYYPGWTARVDGVDTPLYRANLAVRGIRLPKGRHEVRFTYHAPQFVRGLTITLVSASALLLWVAGAVYVDRRKPNVLRSSVPPL